MKKKVILGIVFLLIYCMILSIPLLKSYDDSLILKYDDINLYINNDYVFLNDSNIYKNTSANCMKYLPKYNEFEYKDNIKGFYIFDGKKTLLSTSISFVLELEFINSYKYEEFISYENSRFEYNYDMNIKKNDYECYLVKNQYLTFYSYKNSLPYQFGMLCLNYKKQNARYIYFIECEEPCVDKEFNIVFKNTNCDW